MAAGTKTLKVIISGDSKGAIKALKDVDKASASTAKNAGGLGKALKLGAAGAAAGAAAIVGIAVKSAKTYENVGKEVAKLQRFTGATAEEASRLRAAFKLTGVDTEKAAKSLGILSKNLVAGNVEKYTKAITGVGIVTKDANGKLLPMHGVLLKLADRFKNMQNPAARTTLAMKLFGKAGTDLLPFLTKGAAGIRELEKQSDRLGTTLGQKDLDAIKESTKQHRLFALGMEGLQIQIGRYVLPIMTQLTTFFSDQLPGAILTVRHVMESIGPVLQKVGAGFAELPGFVKIGIGGLALLGPAVGLIAKVFSPMLIGFKAFGSALAALAPLLTTAGLEIAAFFESIVVAAGSAAAAIAAVAIPLAAVVAVGYGLTTTWDSYQANAHEASNATKLIADQVKKTGQSIKTVFATDLKATMMGKALGEGGLLAKQNTGDFIRGMKLAGVSVQDLVGHIGDGDKAWKKWADGIKQSEFKKGFFGGDAFIRTITDLREAYKGAEKALKLYNDKLDAKQKKEAAAALSAGALGKTTKELASDAKILAGVARDSTYTDLLKKANTDLGTVAIGAKELGLSVKEAFSSGNWSPKAILAAVEEMDKFKQAAEDAVNSAGSITNVTDKQLKKGAAGILDFYQGQIGANAKFTDNMTRVMKAHLDPTIITQLMTAGPAAAGPILDAIVKGNVDQNVKQFNVMSQAIRDQAAFVAEQARLLYLATQAPGASEKKAHDLGVATQIAWVQGVGEHKMTAQQLGDALGITPAAAATIAAEFQIEIAPTVKLTEAQKNINILKWNTAAWANSNPTAVAGLGTHPADLGFGSLSRQSAFYKSLSPSTVAGLNKEPAAQQFTDLQALAHDWRVANPTTTAYLDNGPALTAIANTTKALGGLQVAQAQFSAAALSGKFQMAEGGMHEAHSAMISSGITRVWAEPETGGEAYIPLSPAKRGRSMDILGQVASKFGKQLVSFGNGGIMSGGPVGVSPKDWALFTHNMRMGGRTAAMTLKWIEGVVASRHKAGVPKSQHPDGSYQWGEQGFNWKAYGPNPHFPLAKRQFPNGLMGDYTQSGTISRGEWATFGKDPRWRDLWYSDPGDGGDGSYRQPAYRFNQGGMLKSFHTGGTFHAPKGGGGQGLALLRDGERVSTPGSNHGGGDIHVHVHGSLLSGERDIVDAIVRAKRRGLMPA